MKYIIAIMLSLLIPLSSYAQTKNDIKIIVKFEDRGSIQCIPLTKGKSLIREISDGGVFVNTILLDDVCSNTFTYTNK